MFQPTHVLVTRTQRTPVQLISQPTSVGLLTEREWQTGQKPAFEFRSKQGIFCRGVLVVGYRLEPIQVETVTVQSSAQTV